MTAARAAPGDAPAGGRSSPRRPMLWRARAPRPSTAMPRCRTATRPARRAAHLAGALAGRPAHGERRRADFGAAARRLCCRHRLHCTRCSGPTSSRAPSWTRSTRCARRRCSARPRASLQGPDTERAVLDELRRCLSEERPCSGQVTNDRKEQADRFRLEWRISAVRDAERRITHWISFQRALPG